METFLAQFVEVIDGVKLTLLFALVFANFLTGVAVSIYMKEFRLKKLGDFLVSRVLPYLVSYIAVGLIATLEVSWKPAVTAVWGIILASLVGAILTNLKEMGINLPDSLGGSKYDE
ncbi:MAG: phage holin family protein [Candidatus Bathyarchaeia archaeon]